MGVRKASKVERPAEGRSFVEYVEEEKTDIDITKADFLLSVGRESEARMKYLIMKIWRIS